MTRDPERFERPELIAQFILLCKSAGHTVIITCVDRDYKEQTALFAQGREPLEYVNKLRKLVGWEPITQAQNRKCVTWTMNSRHIVNLDDEKLDNDTSEAFDFAVVKDGKAVWDVKADVDMDSIPDYEECAAIGESLGLYSGKNFKNPDYPHLQIRKS